MFAIWPNILPLQHLAMAQIVPGVAPANTTAAGAPANTTATAGAPANTTAAAGAPANTTAEAGAPANTTAAPDAGDPAGEEAVPHCKAAPRVRTTVVMTSTIMTIGGLIAALIIIQRTNSRKITGL